jgi:hypothetical protein
VDSQGRSVGLDVHARSVVACGLEGETGRVSGGASPGPWRALLVSRIAVAECAVQPWRGGRRGMGDVSSGAARAAFTMTACDSHGA